MRSGAIIKLVVGAAIAPVVICSVGGWLALRYVRRASAVIELDSTIGGKRYQSMQRRAQAAFRRQCPRVMLPRAYADACVVNLSEAEIRAPIVACVRPTLLERLDSAWYGGRAGSYAALFGGTYSGGNQVRTCNRRIALIREDMEGWTSYISPHDGLPKQTPIDEPYSGPESVLELLPRGDQVGTIDWVTFTPTPTYELDAFKDGHWVYSFAYWPTTLPDNAVRAQLLSEGGTAQKLEHLKIRHNNNPAATGAK